MSVYATQNEGFSGGIAGRQGVIRGFRAPTPVFIGEAQRVVPARNERCACGTSLSRYNPSHQCAVCESRARQARVLAGQG